MKKNNPIKLERYNLNELPPSWEKDLEKTVLQEELDELKRSDREILNTYKAADMASAIREKMSGTEDKTIPFQKPVRKRRTTILIPAAAMILFGLLLPTMILRNRNIHEDQDITRIKGLGEPLLNIYRKKDGESELLKEYSSASKSDLIQLGYRVADQLFGSIISIDGRGVVTRHFPEEEGGAVRLKTGGEQILPFSYELDDAPEYETFYFITSDEPFPLNTMIDIVAGAARDNGMILDIPDIIERSSLQSDFSGKIQQYAVPITKED